MAIDTRLVGVKPWVGDGLVCVPTEVEYSNGSCCDAASTRILGTRGMRRAGKERRWPHWIRDEHTVRSAPIHQHS